MPERAETRPQEGAEGRSWHEWRNEADEDAPATFVAMDVTALDPADEQPPGSGLAQFGLSSRADIDWRNGFRLLRRRA